ncbi:MbtH family NRPS accessory protein [Streptomyces sp. NPDC059389]|uniref:MbtH family protein n=1 Tax=Streptomyces sp. NPDC059389 TaxID=3346818 RepID=UPI003691B621
MFQDDDEGRYDVVINDEEQYSVWPQLREIPAGWRATGFSGTKDACAAHVDEVWTDMRPLSLRQAMAQDAGADAGAGPR